jgi:hypothetical protein
MRWTASQSDYVWFPSADRLIQSIYPLASWFYHALRQGGGGDRSIWGREEGRDDRSSSDREGVTAAIVPPAGRGREHAGLSLPCVA